MSTTMPLEIQRMTGLDDTSAAILRSFDLEWRCGTRLIRNMLAEGFNAEVIGQALKDALFSYKFMCQQGIGDFERLFFVLGHILQALTKTGTLVDPLRLNRWCDKALVPVEVKEFLLNG